MSKDIVKGTENPGAARIVAEAWALWREAFRMARLLLKEQEPVAFQEREAMERYYGYVPWLAGKLYDDMLGGSAFVHNAKEKDQIERFEHSRDMVAEMKRQNDTEQVQAQE
ncbi:MAG: hypothetical protein ACRDZ4_13160 [Egibacteraceae bacterium]